MKTGKEQTLWTLEEEHSRQREQKVQKPEAAACLKSQGKAKLEGREK